MMSKKLTALAIVALIGLTMCSIALAKKPPKPPPPPPPDADPVIAYSLNGDIWVMDADGSNNTLVTENGVVPSWSPEGDKLTFSYYASYTVNLDGSDRFLLTVQRGGKEWSPGDVLGQGEKIIFYADPYGQYDIFMIDPDGSGLVNLTNTPNVHEGCVSWSPEADRFAAGCLDPDDFSFSLSVYELAVDEESREIYVANVRNIHDEAAEKGVAYPTEFWGLEWANAQEKVAVQVGGPQNPSYDIWTLRLAEPYEMRRITGEGREAHFPGTYEGMPTWSPDDARIAFHVRGGPKYKKLTGIYVVDAEDGTDMVKLEGGGLDPDWYRYADEPAE